MSMEEAKQDYEIIKAALKVMQDTVVFMRTTIDYVTTITYPDRWTEHPVEIYDLPHEKIKRMLAQTKTNYESIRELKRDVLDLIKGWAEADYSDEQWSWGSKVLDAYREWPTWEDVQKDIEWELSEKLEESKK